MKLAPALLLPVLLAAPQDPALSQERLILHTSAGDMVFALYPEAAPQTTAQILKLARLGLFDGLRFSRLEPDFVLQLDDHHRRPVSLTEEQRRAIRKIPLEGKAIRHRRGVLSMARPDDDPDGAETSFSILLGRGEHLDGNYTPFGHLVRGEDVLREIEKVRRRGNEPAVPIVLMSAEVVASPEELKARPLRGPVALQAPPKRPWMVLQTTMGDLLFSLDSAVAPQTVDQIVRAVQMGAFDGTRFTLVRRDLIQAEGHSGRGSGLTHAQRASIRKLPLEPGGHHLRGALHLAHPPDDRNGGETSFCIFLQDVPSFDGEYTVFGRLEKGQEALNAIARVETAEDGTPAKPLLIRQALILGTDEEALAFGLAGPPESAADPAVQAPRLVYWFVGFMMTAGAAVFLLAGRLTPKLVGALGLLVVLIGFFLLYILLVPKAATGRSPWLAVAIFCGSVALFKLMNRFESPRN